VTAAAALAAGLTIEGDLASESTLRLFYLAAATQATGRLVVGAQGQQFALTFKKGVVEHVLAEAAEHDLGQFLSQRGVLKAEALAKAEAARPQAGGDLVGALIALRLVNPADVAALLQEYGAGLVTRALAVEVGRFKWEPGIPPPPSAFPIGNSWALLCTAVRVLPPAAVAQRLGRRVERPASRVGGRIGLELLRLTPQEARAAQQFDGTRAPAEIAAASPGDASMIMRLALLLGEAELLAFGAPRPAGSPASAPAPVPAAEPTPIAPEPAAARAPAAPRPSATPVPAPPRPAAPPAPAAPRAVAAPTRPAVQAAAPAAGPDMAAMKKLYESLATADHFEALGVKREATGAQIKIAYFQLAKLYHPDAVPAAAPPEQRQLAADVFARVSEAWGVLGDDAKRAKYLDDLKTGAGTEVDVLHIFKAEETFQAGTLLVKARRYQEALAKLDEAIQLNADEAEFRIWKGWCEFLLSAEKKRAHTGLANGIEAALKKNPKCISGYLFLGQMAKIVGDLPLAEKNLKRGLKEAPGNADLERELKYLRK
jgi:curved DNA-binding protein CbpA